MRCKLAVARFLSKADFCTSTLITQAIPLAATAIKCNAFDWLYLLWTNMHGEHAASVVHVILAGQFMFFFFVVFSSPLIFPLHISESRRQLALWKACAPSCDRSRGRG